MSAEGKTADLGSLDLRKAAEAGVEVELRHPANGDPLGMFIQIQGMDSRACRDVMLATKRARRAALDAAGQAESSGDQIEEDANTMLVALTLGWRGVVIDDVPLEFSKDSARALYARFHWIRGQLDEVIFSRGKFLGG